MRKATYNLTMFDCDGSETTQEVSGSVSDNFGIHKEAEDVRSARKYVVTHLKSGSLITQFTYKRQAIDFVSRMEKAVFPMPWDTVTRDNLAEASTKNRDKFFDILMLVK